MKPKTLSNTIADSAAIELIDNSAEPMAVFRATVRPEVAKFAIEMEEVLRENDHKHGWDKMIISDLFFRIKDEFEELDEAHAMYVHPLISDGERRSAIQDMRREVLDIANFCMFLCHNYPKTAAI